MAVTAVGNGDYCPLCGETKARLDGGPPRYPGRRTWPEHYWYGCDARGGE